MGRERESRLRVVRRFAPGAIVMIRELREGDEFVTLISGREGHVIERRGECVVVDFEGGERRLHPQVRVGVL